MTRCPFASSGCNGPKEGECLGLCMKPQTRQEKAKDAYKAYRCAGRLAAIRRAVRAFFR